MSYQFTKGMLALVMVGTLYCLSCKKSTTESEAKVKPPVRTYVVTARIDKKGTNSNSEGTAMLKGAYSEESKLLVYTLEYEGVDPREITLRNGAKGSYGALVKELYVYGKGQQKQPFTGSITLSPLQERQLLRGQWFVAVNTATMFPEISGMLTLKQM